MLTIFKLYFAGTFVSLMWLLLALTQQDWLLQHNLWFWGVIPPIVLLVAVPAITLFEYINREGQGQGPNQGPNINGPAIQGNNNV